MEAPLKYIPIDPRVIENRKVRRFVSSLRLDPQTGHVYWINLLLRCGIYHPDGVIDDTDATYLADLCGWNSEPEKLKHAFLKSELLKKQRKKILIADWDSYGGRLIKQRARWRKSKQPGGIGEIGLRDEPNGTDKELCPIPRGNAAPNIIKQNTTKPNKTKYKLGERLACLRVWCHWRKSHQYATATPSEKDLDVIRKALRAGCSRNELIAISNGYHETYPYSQNPRCQSITYMFKDDERRRCGLELSVKLRGKVVQKNKEIIQKNVGADKIHKLFMEYGVAITLEESLRVKCRLNELLPTKTLEEQIESLVPRLKGVPYEQRSLSSVMGGMK